MGASEPNAGNASSRIADIDQELARLYRQQVEVERALTHIQELQTGIIDTGNFLKFHSRFLVSEKRRLCVHDFSELDQSFLLCTLCGQLRSRRRLKRRAASRPTPPSAMSKPAQAKFDWELFQRDHAGAIPDGVHRTTFAAEALKFRSALSLMEEGKTAEQAMAAMRVTSGVAEYPRSPAAQAAEHILRTYFDARHPLQDRLNAAEVERLRREGCPQLNPAQVGYVADDSRIVHVRLTWLYGVNSRELLRDVLLQGGVQFPEGNPLDFIQHTPPKKGSGLKWSKARLAVLATQEVLDFAAGRRRLVVGGMQATFRIREDGAVLRGLTIRMSGKDLVRFVQVLIDMDIPEQLVMWQITRVLMNEGLPVRCVYIDEDGRNMADKSPKSDTFDLRAEFYDSAQTQLGVCRFEAMQRGERQPHLYDGPTNTMATLRCDFRADLTQIDKSSEHTYSHKVHVWN